MREIQDIGEGFTLKIELGNAAMQSPEDVAAALRQAADYIDGIGGIYNHESELTGWHLVAGTVRDANGNTVGAWEANGTEQ